MLSVWPPKRSTIRDGMNIPKDATIAIAGLRPGKIVFDIGNTKAVKKITSFYHWFLVEPNLSNCLADVLGSDAEWPKFSRGL